MNAVFGFESYVERSYCYGEGKVWNVELTAEGRMTAHYIEFGDALRYGYGAESEREKHFRVDVEGTYSKAGSELVFTITKSESKHIGFGTDLVWQWSKATVNGDESKLTLISDDGSTTEINRK